MVSTAKIRFPNSSPMWRLCFSPSLTFPGKFEYEKNFFFFFFFFFNTLVAQVLLHRTNIFGYIMEFDIEVPAQTKTKIH